MGKFAKDTALFTVCVKLGYSQNCPSIFKGFDRLAAYALVNFYIVPLENIQRTYELRKTITASLIQTAPISFTCGVPPKLESRRLTITFVCL